MSTPPLPTIPHLSRRAALKLLAGGAALGLAGCSRPDEEIVPYVDMPERLVPGIPLRFATTLEFAGYGRGVIATSVEGRPIKVEGNPRHPASLGATDVFAEAEILALYDPDRAQAVSGPMGLTTWDDFASALRDQLAKEAARDGVGLRLVTGRITSPTLQRQIAALLQQYPQARWHRYEPVGDDAERAGATLAFGRPLSALPRLGEASAVLSLDCDFLGAGPDQMLNARGFAEARRATGDEKSFQRLYAVEPAWMLTGAKADHRLALRPELIVNFAIAVAAHLRGESADGILPPEGETFAHIVAHDLAGREGRALVLAGRGQPPEVHALAHWINRQLAAAVDLIDPVDRASESHAEGLAALADDLATGRVETLIVLDSNPAYDAPGGAALAEAIAHVPFSACLTRHATETAERCDWQLPLSHALESWGDLRATDGTASIVQPLIRPLYDSRTASEVLAMVDGDLDPHAYDLVRATWQTESRATDFDTWWRGVLEAGVIVGTATAPVHATARFVQPAPATSPTRPVLCLSPDPSLWDGRHANNAWLQECPKPLTKETWGNSLHMAPADAAELGVKDGDLIHVRAGERGFDAPVHIDAGQAAGVFAATIGHGRTAAGAIGNDIGFNAGALRSSIGEWSVADVTVMATGRRRPVPTLQGEFDLDGEADEILPVLSLAELAAGPKGRPFADDVMPTLYPPRDYDTYAWAMVIDADACIGCNACVVACQSENNVPVVGPEQVLVGRDMHWLRIDAYRKDHGAMRGFQPVPCMHCEHAPCEPVCPVEASVHDGEGLNVQVYNRCIGTRFCQSNCPYKVRRFNFFGYADGQEYADLGEAPVKAHNNPDVTVRQRGVMEKCSYCTQRISRARRAAEKEDRRIGEGEVVTACQAACPTQAIHFGDLNAKGSTVSALRQVPRHYALLGHLGTRPRTTYLAPLTNPNPAFDGTAT